jgi:hypothetical protein
MPDTQTAIPEQEDRWAQEPLHELPPRPRRRLFTPIPVALCGVLLLACGFIGGVLVEKGETSSSSGSGAAGLASRFAALRGAAGAGSTASGSGIGGTGGGAGGSVGGGFAGRLRGLSGASGATIGEVSYISGSTLYVTDFEGATVKVKLSPASSITKTVKAGVHSIHPGEMVVIRGAKGSGGAVSAESVSVSAAGATGGGLGALFGGGAGRGGGSAAGAGAGGGGLFGG